MRDRVALVLSSLVAAVALLWAGVVAGRALLRARRRPRDDALARRARFRER